ncbi:MAG: ATP-binding protein [bacterium]|nr:ATP-binding protein [bacterium]
MYLPEDIDDIIQNSETATLEFKEARINFSDSERSDYCAAIANMGGGRLLLGIANNKSVVGTNVYQGAINQIPQQVYQQIGITVSVEEVQHQRGRVVVFDIPPRPVGQRVKSNGGKYTYPVRRGESLGEMDDAMTREILNEVQPDFSSGVADNLTLDDLNERALNDFKKRRAEKTGNRGLLTAQVAQILADVELIRDGKLTFACLLLLGKKEKINAFLPQAEIIYEWRNDPDQIHHDFRTSWRAPYFSVYDEIWNTINARNIRMPYQEGFVQQEILAFDEKACREAVNNAVAHRDYSIGGRSIIIHASPRSFSVISPGGFPNEITPENVLNAPPHWRNRLIAEAFEGTELVERSGQGIDNIFEASIRQGKGLPNFNGTNGVTVQINIPAKVKDTEFIKFLEKVVNEKQAIFSFDEIYELEKLREKKILPVLKHKEKFLKLGIIEKVGKTSGTKYILSHRYYSYQEKPGIYTRIKGFSRESKKELILEHLRREGRGRREDFIDAFPELKPQDVTNLLSELKREDKIKRIGSDRAGHWELKNKLYN